MIQGSRMTKIRKERMTKNDYRRNQMWSLLTSESRLNSTKITQKNQKLPTTNRIIKQCIDYNERWLLTLAYMRVIGTSPFWSQYLVDNIIWDNIKRLYWNSKYVTNVQVFKIIEFNSESDFQPGFDSSPPSYPPCHRLQKAPKWWRKDEKMKFQTRSILQGSKSSISISRITSRPNPSGCHWQKFDPQNICYFENEFNLYVSQVADSFSGSYFQIRSFPHPLTLLPPTHYHPGKLLKH